MKPTLFLLCLLAGAANTAVLMVLLEHRLSWERPLALGVSALALLLLVPAALASLGGLLAPRTRTRQRFLAGFCLLQFLGLAVMGANIAQGRVTVRQWLGSLAPVAAAPQLQPRDSSPPPAHASAPGTGVASATSGTWTDTPSDAGTDTPSDAGMDTPSDAGMDTPSDAGMDTPSLEPRFLYQYEAKGTIIVVDELDKVPSRYRKRVSRIPIEEPAESSPSPMGTAGRPRPRVQLPPELSDWTEMTLPPDVPRPDMQDSTRPAPAVVWARMFQQVDLQCPAGSQLKRETHPNRVPSSLRCMKPGPDGKGISHGPFINIHLNGRISLEGEYRESWHYGRWVTYSPTGERISETLYAEGGQPLSQKFWYPNGAINAAYLFRNKGFDGLVVLWHDNGERQSERWFREGHPQGWEKEWWPNGQLKRQAFTPERGPGKVLTWHSNGQRASAHAYRDGRAHGPAFRWNEDGKLQEIHENRDGQTEGFVEEWYPSGQQRGRWPYRNGEKHGQGMYWYEDGESRSLEYREGYSVYR